MNQLKSLILLASLLTLSSGSTPDNSKSSLLKNRNGKVFSLFSIVTFQNQACQSQNKITTSTTTSSGASRNGTCYTSTECANKGGSASGNCAAGFGVCCLFIVSAASSTLSQNSTYLQNPSFPSVYSATSGLSYTVKKVSGDVCSLRLDFETFTLLGVSAFDETGVCLDSFSITTSPVTNSYPVICGKNAGQHVYIDLGPEATNTATLNFAFSATASTIRTWEIKVTQIPCYSTARPTSPSCFQYHTGITGRFQTFNFAETSTAAQHHLEKHNYNICIRKEAGYCCIEYQVCPDTKSWNIDPTAMAKTGSNCLTDYVGITGASVTCEMSGQILTNRLCGLIFSPVSAMLTNAMACSCVAPFNVQINLNKAATIAETTNQRGVCLQYNQIPC